MSEALLNAEAIGARLSPEAAEWLRGIRVFPAVDSTNSRMVKLVQSEPIGGLAWFAELQTAGRGRRGRRWVTPFGAQHRPELGFRAGLAGRRSRWPEPSHRLGRGGSFCVTRASTRWRSSGPNDVYIGGAKVCGILIEAVTRAEHCACVVGIGLNVDLPADARAAIEQDVTDLRAHGLSMDRNGIAAALTSGIVEAVRRFGREGFLPRRSAYDQLHLCQGRDCRIVQGDRIREGVVLGVTGEGALQVRCAGEIIEFTGGEVSLRPTAGPG